MQAFILGVIEGLTEFLPISSTGHMILGMELMHIKMDEFYKSFLIIIQLGSILSVVVIFYKRLLAGFKLYYKLAVAFVPAGVIGFFAYKILRELFNGYVVALMLILGGIVFIVIEKYYKGRQHKDLDDISYKDAFLIGLGQAVAIIPGTSRSGASIIAGLLVGLSRKASAEFSFLLAIPTMIAATGYSIFKHPEVLVNAQFEPIAIGFITAFIVALCVIKIFLKIIGRLSFIPFGIYRILLGILFYYLFFAGVIDASSV